MAIRGEKNAFTIDNEPRRVPPVKYAKRIIRSTYARLSVAEGRKVPDRPIAMIVVPDVQSADRHVDWSTERRQCREGCVFPHADSTVI